MTSVSFSRNFGSRDSLNVSVRCGLMLWPRQILLTLDLAIPCAAAIVRQLQCVLPLGLVCNVASITALIRAESYVGFRPRPEAISQSDSGPPLRNRSRQRR